MTVVYYRAFWISIEVVRCLLVTWLVPRETAAVSANVRCAPCDYAPVYSVTRSHIHNKFLILKILFLCAHKIRDVFWNLFSFFFFLPFLFFSFPPFSGSIYEIRLVRILLLKFIMTKNKTIPNNRNKPTVKTTILDFKCVSGFGVDFFCMFERS